MKASSTSSSPPSSDSHNIDNDKSSVGPTAEALQELYKGPITRARAREITKQVNLILSSFDFTNKDSLLPNASTLCILRLLGEQELGATKREEREPGAPGEGARRTRRGSKRTRWRHFTYISGRSHQFAGVKFSSFDWRLEKTTLRKLNCVQFSILSSFGFLAKFHMSWASLYLY